MTDPWLVPPESEDQRYGRVAEQLRRRKPWMIALLVCFLLVVLFCCVV
jgi:hypothetical protein